MEEKLDFKKIMPVFVVVLVDLLGLTIIIPLLPLYATSFGANAALIGVLQAVYPLAQFIGAPTLGRLSDRYGRKPVLIVSQIGTLIGFIMLGLANALPILFLSRIIDGLSGANISTAQAIITDVTTEKTRTQGLGLLGAAFGLGFIAGPVIAFLSLALSGGDYHIPAFVAAGFSLLSILLSWFWLDETRRPQESNQQAKPALSFGAMLKALTYPGVGLLLALMFAQQIAFGGFEQIISLFTLTRLGVNASGNTLIFVFVGILVVMVQGYFIGKWSRRYGDRALILLGLGTLASGLALLALTPAQPVNWYNKAELTQELTRQQPGSIASAQAISITLPDETNKGWSGILWLMVGMIPISIGGGILQPSINSLITRQVHQDERGGVLGISAAFMSAANAMAPLIGGALFQTSSSSPFWVWSAIMAALLLAAWALVKSEAPNPSSVTA